MIIAIGENKSVLIYCHPSTIADSRIVKPDQELEADRSSGKVGSGPALVLKLFEPADLRYIQSGVLFLSIER